MCLSVGVHMLVCVSVQCPEGQDTDAFPIFCLYVSKSRTGKKRERNRKPGGKKGMEAV